MLTDIKTILCDLPYHPLAFAFFQYYSTSNHLSALQFYISPTLVPLLKAAALEPKHHLCFKTALALKEREKRGLKGCEGKCLV